MARRRITDTILMDHVSKLGDEHPPILLETVDRTVKRPELVARDYGHILDYLARVELEVDRNVLELLVLLPEVSEVDRYFYADVWQPQEIQHGLILDRLQTDLGLQPSEPMLEVQMSMKMLGALAHIEPIQEVARMMYYLTGAATERQAVLAYNAMTKGMQHLGEEAIADTIIGQIKRQEPGHFAFYKMSAELMVQDEVLKPWQLWLIRQLRRYSYGVVGTNQKKQYAADAGGLMVGLGFADDMEAYAREISRVEKAALFANVKGLDFPSYVLKALRESVEMYRERGGLGERVVP
ncbi:GTP-binding protein LepA [Naumannella halotolerans]|uniref:GTP-binding protein LepA n=1 Tax=Naumannella halotolerans TaxID=993414 RepID=A0A4R7JAC1_9ACTN|nr:GTP-binding protein LepA [Naumannella halotolerans]TDT34274.1 hypothetical protein CLV29_1932 [Naumannella halotolerans]